MQLFESLADVPADFGPSAVSIGKFDGMHAGHQRNVAELLGVAGALQLRSVAVTFDRHPLSVLRPESCPVPLLSNPQKLELLAETGIDATLMLTFDLALSQLPAENFVQTVLVDALRARVLLVGSDFRFGAKGAGDVALLRRLGESHGFTVQLIDDVTSGERRASSTWIRELLSSGEIVEATRLLGRSPSIRATVVGGHQRGRTMGYPTANLSHDVEGFVPADGVYAARIVIDDTKYGAAVSIGNNPTFEGVADKTVEAHVLDQSLDLYGKTVGLEFVEYIRPMNKFPDADALVTQMHIDEERIRTILGQPRP
jgi:riboflavin kinase / FMN adenylyltransferase